MVFFHKPGSFISILLRLYTTLTNSDLCTFFTAGLSDIGPEFLPELHIKDWAGCFGMLPSPGLHDDVLHGLVLPDPGPDGGLAHPDCFCSSLIRFESMTINISSCLSEFLENIY